MQSIATQLQQARQVLAPIAGENAALEARLLAAHAWGMTPQQLVVVDGNELRDAAALEALVSRRTQAEPVAQILGEKAFWRDRFIVSPDVLTPRADSETVIEQLLRMKPDAAAPLRLLDLGTGSGCLLLSALREYPNATGVGVDQSEAALAVASQNAAALGLGQRSYFVRSNWCSHVTGVFDVVLSNPPYIPSDIISTLAPDVNQYEPLSALDGGADGLDCYRAILAQIRPHLAPQAALLFEVGAGQAEDVAALGQANGFTLNSITSDLAGIARVVAF